MSNIMAVDRVADAIRSFRSFFYLSHELRLFEHIVAPSRPRAERELRVILYPFPIPGRYAICIPVIPKRLAKPLITKNEPTCASLITSLQHHRPQTHLPTLHRTRIRIRRTPRAPYDLHIPLPLPLHKRPSLLLLRLLPI